MDSNVLASFDHMIPSGKPFWLPRGEEGGVWGACAHIPCLQAGLLTVPLGVHRCSEGLMRKWTIGLLLHTYTCTHVWVFIKKSLLCHYNTGLYVGGCTGFTPTNKVCLM